MHEKETDNGEGGLERMRFEEAWLYFAVLQGKHAHAWKPSRRIWEGSWDLYFWTTEQMSRNHVFEVP